MRNFPSFFDAYLDYTKGHESTRRVRLWSAISIVAGALERKVTLDRAYYSLKPNLYIFIIGKSGLIKKSTSTAIAVDLLRSVKTVKIMAERLTASSVIEQLAAAGRTVDYKGGKVGQSAVFAYASELAVFLTEVFGSITELLTTFYDGGPKDPTQPWVYQTIGRGERKIFGPCLNILGASTKAWLRKCIPTSEMEGGFTSRIIFVVENNLPDKLIAWPELSHEDELNRLKLIEDLKSIHNLSGEFMVTEDAKDLFTRWYDHHCRVVIPTVKDPRIIGYQSRKGDTILKLAMIHSASEREDLILTRKDLVWAQNALEELEGDWKQAFESVLRVTGLASDILEFIRPHGMIEKKKVISNFSANIPYDTIMRAILNLKDLGEIQDVVTVANDKGQRLEYYALVGYENLGRPKPV